MAGRGFANLAVGGSLLYLTLFLDEALHGRGVLSSIYRISVPPPIPFPYSLSLLLKSKLVSLQGDKDKYIREETVG
jgi:hypothetical protein